jgi:hypothetical protein
MFGILLVYVRAIFCIGSSYFLFSSFIFIIWLRVKYDYDHSFRSQLIEETLQWQLIICWSWNTPYFLTPSHLLLNDFYHISLWCLDNGWSYSYADLKSDLDIFVFPSNILVCDVERTKSKLHINIMIMMSLELDVTSF